MKKRIAKLLGIVLVVGGLLGAQLGAQALNLVEVDTVHAGIKNPGGHG